MTILTRPLPGLARPGAHRKPGIPWRYQALLIVTLTMLGMGALAAVPGHIDKRQVVPHCARFGDCRGRQIGRFHCGNHCPQLPQEAKR